MDRGKVDAFLARFVELASGATTIGLLAVADRSGLSLHLGRAGGGTAAEIAGDAGLDQRYVREILSGLAAAGVVVYDPVSTRFDLPPEHALFLADETSPYFMAGFLDMIPLFMSQIDGVAEATVNGGGVSFEAYGEAVIRAIARAQTPSQRTFLVARWLPAVPGLVPRLETGSRVADVGCGTGTAVIIMGGAYPNSSVLGFDVSAASIATARERAAGLGNVRFAALDVEELPTDPPFDLITSFDVIHDLIDPRSALRRIREALARDGVFLMMEPNAGSNLEENLTPRGAMLYGTSTLHCMTQSLAKGGAGLGAAWGRQQAETMAGEAGFSSFEPLDGISNQFSAFYLLRP